MKHPLGESNPRSRTENQESTCHKGQRHNALQSDENIAGAEQGAVTGNPLPQDPALETVIQAWPSLPNRFGQASWQWYAVRPNRTTVTPRGQRPEDWPLKDIEGDDVPPADTRRKAGRLATR